MAFLLPMYSVTGCGEAYFEGFTDAAATSDGWMTQSTLVETATGRAVLVQLREAFHEFPSEDMYYSFYEHGDAKSGETIWRTTAYHAPPASPEMKNPGKLYYRKRFDLKSTEEVITYHRQVIVGEFVDPVD